MLKLTLIPVTPTATNKRLALVRLAGGGGGARWLDTPEYPASPNGERLRRERIAAGITIRDAAQRLGISLSEFSGLEMGRFQVSEEEWGIVWGMLNQKGRV